MVVLILRINIVQSLEINSHISLAYRRNLYKVLGVKAPLEIMSVGRFGLQQS